MTNEMQAIFYLGPRQLELRCVPRPAIEPDEVLVKVRASTTCGTDVKTYLRGHPKYPPPFPFGHEFAGDVVELGSMVHTLREGMRVTASCFGPCGKCYYCKHHQENLCENMVHNFGTYAEYLKLPAPFVHWNTLEVPDGLSYAQAALLEPLASVVHGHKHIQVRPGETVAILGGGGAVGLMHLQLARASGASKAIVVDLIDERLDFARNLGAEVLNPTRVDPAAMIKELTGGRGVDVAIECGGAKQTWEMALQVVRKGGRVLWFGGLADGTRIEMDAPAVHYREIGIFNTHGNSPADFWEACNLVASGIVRTELMLSPEMRLAETEQALELMIAGKAMKVPINPELS